MANAKKNFKFKVGKCVRYVGEDVNLKGKEFIVESHEMIKPFMKKPYNVYSLTKRGSNQVILRVKEELLKVVVDNPEGKKFINKIDERAKEIQKASGVKKVERVTFYNISRSEAKEKAFKEAKK